MLSLLHSSTIRRISFIQRTFASEVVQLNERENSLTRFEIRNPCVISGVRWKPILTIRVNNSHNFHWESSAIFECPFLRISLLNPQNDVIEKKESASGALCLSKKSFFPVQHKFSIVDQVSRIKTKSFLMDLLGYSRIGRMHLNLFHGC